MARLSKAERQEIVNDFLNQSGMNTFIPADFLTWLKPQEQHPAWDRFFSKSDAEAAQAWRVDQARAFVSDLRVKVLLPVAPVPTAVDVPVFVSVAQKSSWYQTLDPDDSKQRAAELGRGVSALPGWHQRYSWLATLHGCAIDAELGAAIARLESAIAG